MSDDNVVQLGFKRDPADEISQEDWARELCRTVMRNDPSLPEAAIDRKVANYSDEQMQFVCYAVIAVISKCITKIDDGVDITTHAGWD